MKIKYLPQNHSVHQVTLCFLLKEKTLCSKHNCFRFSPLSEIKQLIDNSYVFHRILHSIFPECIFVLTMPKWYV